MKNSEQDNHRNAGRRWMVLLFALVSFFTLTFAQPGMPFKTTAQGTIVDSKTAEPLYAATV